MEDAEKIMTAGAYATRSERTGVDINITEQDIRRMIKWAKKMRLSSVLDFGYYIFSIEGVSRSFTHQWVRYRIAAHMQQSLRYVKIDVSKPDWFVVPPEIVKKGVDAIVEYVSAILNSGRLYLKLLRCGVPPEDARFVLPIGVKTHISSAFDPEEMIHIIYQRTCFDAQWEIRTVAYSMLLAGLIVHPNIFDGCGPPCLYIGDGVCRGSRKGQCKADAEKLISTINRLAREYRQRFEELDPGTFLRIDLTDILGFHAPKDVVDEVSRAMGMNIPLDKNVILEVRRK